MRMIKMLARGTTVFVAVALGLSGFTAGGVPASAVAASRRRAPIEAKGVNIFEASELRYVDFFVPKSAWIFKRDWTSGRDRWPYEIEGGGRLAGFLLIEAPERKDYANRRMFFAFRPPTCWERGCDGRTGQIGSIGVGKSPDGWRLPAGNWRLYLIADGAPVRLKLRLTGLSGRARFYPEGRSRAAGIDAVPVQHDPGGTGNVYSAGSEGPVRAGSEGFGVLVMSTTGAAKAASSWGECVYQEEVPAGPLTWMPGCPTGESLLRSYSGPSGGHEFGLARFVYDIPAGLGSWHVTAGTPTETNALAMWIPFF